MDVLFTVMRKFGCSLTSKHLNKCSNGRENWSARGHLIIYYRILVGWQDVLLQRPTEMNHTFGAVVKLSHTYFWHLKIACGSMKVGWILLHRSSFSSRLLFLFNPCFYFVYLLKEIVVETGGHLYRGTNGRGCCIQALYTHEHSTPSNASIIEYVLHLLSQLSSLVFWNM